MRVLLVVLTRGTADIVAVGLLNSDDNMTVEEKARECAHANPSIVLECREHLDGHCLGCDHDTATYLIGHAAALAELEEVLKFYADPATYFAIAFIPDRPCGDFMDDFDETELGPKPGAKARAALRSWRKGGRE